MKSASGHLLIGLLTAALNASAAESQFTKLGLDKTNPPPPDIGWLRVPSKEILLNVQHEPIAPKSRRAASELTYFIIQELLHADYTVRLRPAFIEKEIQYYQSFTNQTGDVGARILGCLMRAKSSGALDWECLRSATSQKASDPIEEANLPWSQPPRKSNLLQMSRPEDDSIPELTLKMQWAGKVTPGAVRDYRGGQIVGGVSGTSMLWNPSASLNLRCAGHDTFQKDYPALKLQRFYYKSTDRPLEVTTLAILQDIRNGLQPKPESPPKTKKRPR
jgi:hypothetical protein